MTPANTPTSIEADIPLLDGIALIERFRQARLKHQPRCNYEPGRRDFNPLDRFQLQFHKAKHPIRAMFPGNGAGKTTVAGVEADYWLQHDHPYQETPLWKIQVVWVCLKFQQMDMIREQLEANCFTAGYIWNDNKHKYTWPHGDSLYVVSNDGDWASIQGVSPDLVVIDEECDIRLWREFTMRRRGKKQTKYVISATATKGKRWMYSEIYEPWLKYHQALNIGEFDAMKRQLHPTRWVWPYGGIEDNPGARAGDIVWYSDELALASPAERQVRLKGGFKDFNASPVFDQPALELMDRVNSAGDLRVAGRNGNFRSLKLLERKFPHFLEEFEFVPNMLIEGGRITIFEEPKDDNYVIGGDFGYGLENRDMDAAVVLRQSTGEQVAAASGRWGDVGFAWVLWALGWYYREALIVGERQVGLPTLRRLYDEWGYTFIYRNKDDEHAAPRPSDLLGHHATHGDLIIPQLAWAICPKDPKTGERFPSRIRVTDAETLKQCKEYEWRPRSKMIELSQARNTDLSHSAPLGQHDDLVMALAYAVRGWIELPKFIIDKPQHPAGSLGQVLRHREVWKPAPKSQSPFAHAAGNKPAVGPYGKLPTGYVPPRK